MNSDSPSSIYIRFSKSNGSFDNISLNGQESFEDVPYDSDIPDGSAQCTNKMCGFKFCIKCSCPYHVNGQCDRDIDNEDNAADDENQEDQINYVACSKQSKRNLRRLCSLDN